MPLHFPSFQELGDKLARAVARFPLAVFWAIAGTVLALMLIDSANNHEDQKIGRYLLACSLGLPLSVGLAVFSEKNALPAGQKWALQLLALPVLAFAWWAIDPGNDFRQMHNLVWYFGLSFLFHLFVSFAAFLKKGDSVLDFWEFNKQLFINFLAAGIYSSVIFGGLAIAIVASNELFHLHLEGKIYARLFAVVAGLFQTMYFLSNFPKDFEFDHAEIRFDSLVKNLVKWILIPIVGLYFLILYTYSGDILAKRSLPIGWASSLVVGFSVAGIFTWLMNFMLPRFDGSGIILWFKKWFWPILTPMLVLLFVAVGRRISDYGLTEDRYLIAHLGAWLGLMAAYFILSKKDDIRIIPISLAIFTIIYLLPGIGGMDEGIRAQTQILTRLMEKNGLLKDGKAVPQKEVFKGDNAGRMNSIVLYLVQRDALAPVANWLGKTDTDFKIKTEPYQVQNKISSELGISEAYNNRVSAEFRHYHRQHSNALSALSVSGYDSLFLAQIPRGSNIPQHGFLLDEDGHTAVFDGKKTDLQPVLDGLWGNADDAEPYLDSLDHLDFSGNSSRCRLLLDEIPLKMSDDGVKLESVSGWLLVKKN